MDEDTLIIFARYPRPGMVKSRLASSIGPRYACQIYRAMVEDSLKRLPSHGRRTLLYLSDCDETEANALVSQLDCPSPVRVQLQRGEDLGARMWDAYSFARQSSGRVVIVGTDTPDLPPSLVNQAFIELRTAEVVVGPVSDGGYYLIGLSSPIRSLFEGISWGSALVLAQTLSKLRDASFTLLPEWYDIDVVEDLDRLENTVGDFSELSTLRLLRQLRQSGSIPSHLKRNT